MKISLAEKLLEIIRSKYREKFPKREEIPIDLSLTAYLIPWTDAPEEYQNIGEVVMKEFMENLDFSVDYKEMYFRAVTAWLTEMGQGDGIEDHHVIADVMHYLICTEEFARETVAEVSRRQPGLIINRV